MPYPLLTSPAVVGGLPLSSRAVMGSMHTGMEDRRRHLSELAAYFAARARGGAGLIVTGGFAPDRRGWLLPFASAMTTTATARAHRPVTDAVHAEGGRIMLQLLHAGRYGYTPLAVSASTTKSPISPFPAVGLSARGVERTVDHFVRAARLARLAGYDGVEVMGSEGYLINQFLRAGLNTRTDHWGGTASKRMRFPVEIVRRIRAELGEDFALMYRASILDLVPGGQTWDETVELVGRIAEAGASIVNTGIGWHEARIPTIVTSVPRAAFADLAVRLRREVDVPVCASNRINDPAVAERLLQGGVDLVSMARPFLADPEFVRKAREGREDEINTCIACNQACLDHTFRNQRASCLVNPRAGRETTLVLRPTRRRRRVAVVGSGPAGLAAATGAAERGHAVTVFEAADEIGGQFRLALRIPGKEEFAATLRWYRRQLELRGVDVRLATTASAADLTGFDDVVVATGVEPRTVEFPGADHPRVVPYPVAITDPAAIGSRVAVIGAGGIGVDVAHLLTAPAHTDLAAWRTRWGVGDPAQHRAGLAPRPRLAPARKVWLLQRSSGPLGRNLGKTTGWVHRAELRDAGVHQWGGVTYERVDDDGLHVTVDGTSRVLPVDHVVVCAGQVARRWLVDDLTARGVTPHVVGGAARAAELDAERAILQGTELAARL